MHFIVIPIFYNNMKGSSFMSIFKNNVSSNYFIDGTCTYESFCNYTDSILVMNEAIKSIDENKVTDTLKNIKDEIAKLFNRFIEAIKGLWDKIITAIQDFYAKHNFGTLIARILDKKTNKISKESINKLNDILQKNNLKVVVPSINSSLNIFSFGFDKFEEIYDTAGVLKKGVISYVERDINDLYEEYNSLYKSSNTKPSNIYDFNQKLKSISEEVNKINFKMKFENNINTLNQQVKNDVDLNDKESVFDSFVGDNADFLAASSKVSIEDINIFINAIRSNGSNINNIKREFKKDIDKINANKKDTLNKIKNSKQYIDYNKNSNDYQIDKAYLNLIILDLKFNYKKKSAMLMLQRIIYISALYQVSLLFRVISKINSGTSEEDVVKYIEKKYSIVNK